MYRTTTTSTPVASTTVTLSQPAKSGTFTVSALSLTLNGQGVTLDNTVKVQLVSGSTYQVTGLAAFQKQPGLYVLSVDGTTIQNDFGVNVG